MKLNVAVAGAMGRMGRRLVVLIEQSSDLELSGALEHASYPGLGEDIGVLCGVGPLGVPLGADPLRALAGAHVLVEFTRAAHMPELVRHAAKLGVPLVSGTTGLDDAAQAALNEAGQHIPVLWAANFSVGMAVLRSLVAEAAARLEDFDVEILELHHRHKTDAPSGSALELARAAGARPDGPRWLLQERSGQVGPRSEAELGVFALRGGDATGEHTVYLLGEGERIELTHRATSRDIFVRGALRAARWIVQQPAGRYALEALWD